MSDEGLMTDDIQACLNVVLEALRMCDLPAAEVIAWCTQMRKRDRVGFICDEELRYHAGRQASVRAFPPGIALELELCTGVASDRVGRHDLRQSGPLRFRPSGGAPPRVVMHLDPSGSSGMVVLHLRPSDGDLR